ncbi:hypothetical protein BCR35DRAFT_308500 [Leucosporidium creatinivorum]|uniref:F-box domain-containing protein n=1 Tax=Leucosporidium creatinivorum TaxID=106004 RepID=A0A1Y2E527_9BASI|nr:hypothetical protein BCR35DRAFT_308500 [Leucosporidium creatinivorum]
MVVPPLPVEIVEHIIKQSLPPLRFSTFNKRYRLLRKFSLVDSRWRVLAQRELGRHVLVKNGQSRSLADERAGFPEYLKHTKSFWGRSSIEDERHNVGMATYRLLKAHEGVEELCLSYIPTLDCLLLAAQHLRAFTGNCVDLELDSSIPPLPLLTYISLVDPLLARYTSAWSRLLNPTTLPSLRSLKLLRLDEVDFIHGADSSNEEINTIIQPLLSLAARLEVFAIFERDEQAVANRLTTEDWKRFVELQHLTIGRRSTALSTWINSPDSIPPRLKTLVILDLGDGGDRDEVYEELRGVVAKWRGEGRRQLVIKHKVAVEKVDAGAVTGARESLLRSAKEREIVVREVLANGSFDDWQTFFDVWWVLPLVLSSRSS